MMRPPGGASRLVDTTSSRFVAEWGGRTSLLPPWSDRPEGTVARGYTAVFDGALSEPATYSPAHHDGSG